MGSSRVSWSFSTSVPVPGKPVWVRVLTSGLSNRVRYRTRVFCFGGCGFGKKSPTGSSLRIVRSYSCFALRRVTPENWLASSSSGSFLLPHSFLLHGTGCSSIICERKFDECGASQFSKRCFTVFENCSAVFLPVPKFPSLQPANFQTIQYSFTIFEGNPTKLINCIVANSYLRRFTQHIWWLEAQQYDQWRKAATNDAVRDIRYHYPDIATRVLVSGNGFISSLQSRTTSNLQGCKSSSGCPGEHSRRPCAQCQNHQDQFQRNFQANVGGGTQVDLAPVAKAEFRAMVHQSNASGEFHRKVISQKLDCRYPRNFVASSQNPSKTRPRQRNFSKTMFTTTWLQSIPKKRQNYFLRNTAYSTFDKHIWEDYESTSRMTWSRHTTIQRHTALV